MKFLDANIFVRFLTGDDPAKAERCRLLFESLDRGEDEAATSESVITEVVRVLMSKALYARSREDTAGLLHPILAIRGLRIPAREAVVEALDLFVDHPFLDFPDALYAAHGHHSGYEAIVSYDKEFDRVPGVVRAEP